MKLRRQVRRSASEEIFNIRIIDIRKIKWRDMARRTILHLSPPLLAKEMDLSPLP
jgi:hypothetical protein